MSDIENGRRNVSLQVISRIADCLGMTLHDLFVEMEREQSLTSTP